MEIILAKDYPTLGFVGDVLKVKRGYARNYLIPQGLAVESSSRNKSQLKHKVDAILAVKKRLKVEAEKRAEELKQVQIKLIIKVGEAGKTFGSVGTRDIEQALQAQGIEVSRKQIVLTEPIKSVGEFSVVVKLHSEVTTELRVAVVADKALPTKTKRKSKKEISEDVAQDGGLDDQPAQVDSEVEA